MKYLYGLTEDQWAELSKAQGGVCGICNQPETTKKKSTGRIQRLSTDHCHSSGDVRGLLCASCNQALGLFKDDRQLLRSAIDYLEKSTKTTNLQEKIQ